MTFLDAAAMAVRRVVRGLRIGATAALVYLRLKIPRWLDRLRGRDPGQRNMTAIHQANAEHIFATASDLKGLLIKMCQIIGTRSDVFPAPYVKTLSQAQDRLPPRPFEQIRPVIEEDFGCALEEVYGAFDPIPVAAASLAQVHRATLHDGREVAVKVRYPDIDGIVTTDLISSRIICKIYEYFDPQPLELLPLLDDMQKYLTLELDFRREVENAEQKEHHPAA